MTDQPDPLEARLHGLKPQPISAALRERIAGRITASARARRRILRGSLIALAAAVVIAVSVVWVPRRAGPDKPGASVAKAPAPSSEAVPRRVYRPMLAARQLAEAKNLDEMDAVLDQYAPRWLVFTETDRDVLTAPDL
jgi:hypothetical protein